MTEPQNKENFKKAIMGDLKICPHGNDPHWCVKCKDMRFDKEINRTLGKAQEVNDDAKEIIDRYERARHEKEEDDREDL